MTDPQGEDTFVWNVAGLLGDAVGSDRVYEITDGRVPLAEDLELAAPITGRVRLTRTNRGILAEATVSTALAGECSRCLRPAVTPIQVRLEEEHLPSLDLQSGAPVSTAEEPDAMRLTDHHEVDLGPSVADAIALAEPIAPLDRPDCPGLCPVCGLPLDEGSHDHPADDVDPRLEALRAFQPEGD